MTVTQHLVGATPRSSTFLSRLPEAALSALLVALLAGAWLAFFWFVPFDFTPPRPS